MPPRWCGRRPNRYASQSRSAHPLPPASELPSARNSWSQHACEPSGGIRVGVFEDRLRTLIPLDDAAHRVLVGVRVVDAEHHEPPEPQGKQWPVVLEGKIGSTLELDDHGSHDCGGSRQRSSEAELCDDRLVHVTLTT